VSSTNSSDVVLNERASKLARRGQQWFFADDLAGSPSQSLTAGLARLRDDRGKDLGVAFTSPSSKLTVRRAGPWSDARLPSPSEFFRARLSTAIAYRMAHPRYVAPSAGVRLVHGEADQLPGLVVDRYADCVVMQLGNAALEALRADLVEQVEHLLQPRMVLARNDFAVRRLEGLESEIQLLSGRRVEEVAIEEDGLTHTVRTFEGHKTGFYLDQAPARALVRGLARGRRVLDTFAYQGGFAVAALAGGASSALAIDESAPALERALAAAARNQLRGLTTRCANVFDALRELRGQGEQFDLVIVDPPAFAKSRRERSGGLRGYRDLNRQALRLLAPGGFLVTCSCSHHISLPDFEEVVRQAAAELPFPMFLRKRLGAGLDHPVLVGLPESEYLKVLIVERGGSESPPTVPSPPA
jgi:23S rRNA (cytosine1962-C5)-methyltransferase